MRRRLMVIVLFDRVDLLDVTGPPEVLSLLAREMDEATGYEVVLAAESLEPVTTSAGVRVLPDVTFEQVAHRAVDTLIVPGAVERDAQRRVTAVVDDRIVAHVRELAIRSRRVASVCVGAHVLAAAGLLDGRRATTHWSTAAQLAAQHPDVDVEPDPIFIKQGDVWTGAGLTACLDLTLALVAEDFGEPMAARVARQLVMYLKRPSGQSQFSVPLSAPTTTRRIDELRLHILAHVDGDLTVHALADVARVSERHLTRLFRTELRTTPGAYVESLRVETARNRLESTDDTLSRVASACGFGAVDTLTRAFHRTLGVSPGEYRKRFRIAG
ncbi:GlxA family transcriptional regulator [Microbacterium sp. 1.5R]|uniref:GlxA family transcriptional regulator n=1 Tax=Microbacterium sp. 1.5R TaxID=1916917 RepID=UPI0011A1726A|nr:DJ-1/PfpI family protein [Microbacterium sp. 1.5R]